MYPRGGHLLHQAFNHKFVQFFSLKFDIKFLSTHAQQITEFTFK